MVPTAALRCPNGRSATMHMKEDTRNMPITHDHTASSPHELDALIEALRNSIAHHLATGSPRSAASGRKALEQLGALLDSPGCTAACGGGSIEHQPALAGLLALLSHQAIATPHADAGLRAAWKRSVTAPTPGWATCCARRSRNWRRRGGCGNAAQAIWNVMSTSSRTRLNHGTGPRIARRVRSRANSRLPVSNPTEIETCLTPRCAG